MQSKGPYITRTPLDRIPQDTTFGAADALIAQAARAAAQAYAAHSAEDHPGRGCEDFRVFLIAKVAEAIGAGAAITQSAGSLSRFWTMQKIRPHLHVIYAHGADGATKLAAALVEAEVEPEVAHGICSLVAVIAAASQLGGRAKSSDAEARAAIGEVVRLVTAANGIEPPAGPHARPQGPAGGPAFMKAAPRGMQ